MQELQRDMDPNKPNMAEGFFVDRAIEDAAFILERIDARWSTIVNTFSCERALEETALLFNPQFQSFKFLLGHALQSHRGGQM